MKKSLFFIIISIAFLLAGADAFAQDIKKTLLHGARLRYIF